MNTQSFTFYNNMNKQQLVSFLVLALVAVASFGFIKLTPQIKQVIQPASSVQSNTDKNPGSFSLSNLSLNPGSTSTPTTGTTSITPKPQKVFLMGGGGQNGIDNDVWSSSGNLDNWSEISQNNFWLGNNFCAVYMNGKIFAVVPDYPNKVYSSVDGINWNLVLNAAPFGARNGYSCTVLNNKIWIAGGVLLNNNAYMNDVWSSPDGVNWTEATSAASWQARDQYSLLNFQNKLWVLGGENLGGDFNDVWSSPDGVNWTEATSAASWQARYSNASSVFNNKMWIVGGFSNEIHSYMNDVWSSPDGVNWIEVTSGTSWPPRMYHQSVSFNNKLWVLGGAVFGGEVDDVWSSSDGLAWAQSTSAAQWSPRAGHQTVVTPASFGCSVSVIQGLDVPPSPLVIGAQNTYRFRIHTCDQPMTLKEIDFSTLYSSGVKIDNVKLQINSTTIASAGPASAAAYYPIFKPNYTIPAYSDQDFYVNENVTGNLVSGSHISTTLKNIIATSGSTNVTWTNTFPLGTLTLTYP